MKTFTQQLPILVGFGILTSCQKEVYEQVEKKQEPKSIQLQIQAGLTYPQYSSSKSVSYPVTTADEISFNDGIVYFLNTQGNVLSTADLIASQAGGVLGQTFENISPEATNVYVVGNYKGITPSIESALKSASNISAIKSVVSTIETQQISHKSVVLANLIDVSPTFIAYDGLIKREKDNYKVMVLLGPVVSKIQLSDIKTTDVRITGFSFNGVYIDNYYPNFGMATDIIGNPTRLTFGTIVANLATAQKGMFDKPASPIISGPDKLVYAHEAIEGKISQNVWTYQLAPVRGAVNLPRLIIVLNDVMVIPNGGGEAVNVGIKYLTIYGYTDGLNIVTSFVPGKLYHIPSGAVDFSVENLGDTPNAPKSYMIVLCKTKHWDNKDIGYVM